MIDGGRFGPLYRPLPLAVLGGIGYVVGVFLWAVTTGVHPTTEDLLPTVTAVSYAVFGMFLIAAVPLYLLSRFSMVTPAAVAAWSLGNTMYLRWHVSRPHDALASYLTVWPIFVGIIVAVTILETLLRIRSDRSIGRFGLRRLF